MSSIFTGLQIGISTLMAHQMAINVTSNNIANINTPGYQRQRAVLRELNGPSGLQMPPYIGTGVQAHMIERYVTPFLDRQLRHQHSTLGNARQTEELLSSVETVLKEPAEASIGNYLDRFWQAWQELSTAPAERAFRISVLQAGQQLAASLNEAYRFVEGLRNNLNAQVRFSVERINDIAAEIEFLNRQIVEANARASHGTLGAVSLEQQRDALLTELSDHVEVTVSFQESGMARVAIGTYPLVDEGGARSVVLDGNVNPVWADNNLPVDVRSGSLYGSLAMRDRTLTSILDQMDRLAGGIIDNVNALHRNGFGLNGSTGLNFFSGSGARSIAVNASLAPDDLASAATDNSPGDNSIAMQIAGLSSRLTMGGPPPTTSINGYYRSFITDLGLQVRRAKNSVTSNEELLNHLEERRLSLSGVSMDEEVANLLTFEKAYQAGARIITAVDQMLDHLINNTGTVGR